jgi:hypothetical protein
MIQYRFYRCCFFFSRLMAWSTGLFCIDSEKFHTLFSFYCSYGPSQWFNSKIALGIMLGSILWECRELLYWFVDKRELVVQSQQHFHHLVLLRLRLKLIMGCFSTARIIRASLCCPTESFKRVFFRWFKRTSFSHWETIFFVRWRVVCTSQ